jgi:SAM-dependent methyltransferase
MNHLPDDLGTYDFLWSCCAFEHIGSLEAGIRFVLEANRFLKPGGVAIHTTEYNFSSNDETVETQHLCLYRRRDLEDMARRVEAQGNRILPLNFTAGPQVTHLKLLIEKFVTTSFGFAIVKAGA